MSKKQFLELFGSTKPVKITTYIGDENTRQFDPFDRLEGSVISQSLEDAGLGYIEMPFDVLTIVGQEMLTSIVKGKLTKIDPTQITALGDKEAHPEYWTKKIKVPWVPGYRVSSELWIMERLTAMANSLVMKVSDSIVGTATPDELQAKVTAYQNELVSTVCGKSGLIRTDLFETRLKRSMRAVAIPNIQLSHEEVGISTRHAKKLLKGKDNTYYAILDRDPNLWRGSVLVCKARITNTKDDCIHVSPFLFKLMGCDFDGDCVSIVVPDTDADPELATILEEHVGKTAVEYAQWSEEFLLVKKDTEIDFDDVHVDVFGRASALYTLSPKDILNPTESVFFNRCLETGAKRVPEGDDGVVAYAHGVSVQHFMKVALDTTMQLTRVKREVGMVGALTDKIAQLVYMLRPELLDTALSLKEAMTQALMDSKAGTDAFDIHAIRNVFERQDPDINEDVNAAIGKLVSLGLPKHLIEPVLEVIWDLGKLSKAIKDMLPQYAITRGVDKTLLMEWLTRRRDDTIDTFECVIDQIEHAHKLAELDTDTNDEEYEEDNNLASEFDTDGPMPARRFKPELPVPTKTTRSNKNSSGSPVVAGTS